MIEDDTDGQFALLHSQLRDQMPPQRQKLLDQLTAISPCKEGCRGFENLGKTAVAKLEKAAEVADREERRDFSRALIAGLATQTRDLLSERRITEEFVRRSQDWMTTLSEFLRDTTMEEYWFPNDLFVKDYRFVTAITLPCGAQVVDLNDGVGPKTALKYAAQNPIAAFRAYRAPWFRVHTEGRYLDEFNDVGWQNCYRAIADLLAINPHIRGMAATSWFYDPVLSDISPRLGYLRELPMQNGAVLIPHGTTEFDIQSATATSGTRRKLHAEGRYLPKCYSVLWHRESMMAWAEETGNTAHS